MPGSEPAPLNLEALPYERFIIHVVGFDRVIHYDDTLDN